MRIITAIISVIGAVALAMLAVAPAAAARPAELSGSITLATDDSSAAQSVGPESTSSWPSYGESVEFDTTVEGKLHKQARVYVTVVCMQGDDVVYQWSEDVDFSFPLLDSAGLDWDGDAASCEAWLISRVDKGKSADITVIDTESFEVGPFTL